MFLFALQTHAILDFALSAWEKSPSLRIEDAYKWLFHATLGGEHAVQDDSGPRQWLDNEWTTLGKPLPNEPMTVSLRPDTKIIRVNLRPYKAAGGDKEMLLAIFVASARQFHAERRSFTSEWRELGSRLSVHPLPKIRYSDWTRLDRETKADGYPAIDHSAVYEKTEKPAYRVILKELWISPK